jgi:hypothetical protein
MTAKRQKGSKPKSGRTKATKSDVAVDCSGVAPIEHYRGEKNNLGTTGDAGDVELETLDPRAPYNNTYGR